MPSQLERLHAAIALGNLLIVKRLLERFPALLTEMDPRNGWLALHHAAHHGHYLICNHLVVQLTLAGVMGEDSALRETCEVLYDFAANTPLHLAVQCHEQLLQTAHYLLQQFPGIINRQNNSGSTALHVACQHNLQRMVLLLLDLGADVRVADAAGDTPLHLCCKYGVVRCIEEVLGHSVLLDGPNLTTIKNNRGFLPLEVCFDYETERCVEQLSAHYRTARSAASTDLSAHPPAALASLTGLSPLRLLLSTLFLFARRKHSSTVLLHRLEEELPLDNVLTLSPLPVITLVRRRRLESTTLTLSDGVLMVLLLNHSGSLHRVSPTRTPDAARAPALPPAPPPAAPSSPARRVPPPSLHRIRSLSLVNALPPGPPVRRTQTEPFATPLPLSTPPPLATPRTHLSGRMSTRTFRLNSELPRAKPPPSDDVRRAAAALHRQQPEPQSPAQQRLRSHTPFVGLVLHVPISSAREA